jgi:hypothetical protein
MGTSSERYLDLERIRYAERPRRARRFAGRDAGRTLPSFALQTLVENAVRHAAMPRASSRPGGGRGTSRERRFAGARHGHGRWRRCLDPSPRVRGPACGGCANAWAALYGDRARLEVGNGDRGFTATLVVPQTNAKSADTEADA